VIVVERNLFDPEDQWIQSVSTITIFMCAKTVMLNDLHRKEVYRQNKYGT
jgi:hypothetical protein